MKDVLFIYAMNTPLNSPWEKYGLEYSLEYNQSIPEVNSSEKIAAARYLKHTCDDVMLRYMSEVTVYETIDVGANPEARLLLWCNADDGSILRIVVSCEDPRVSDHNRPYSVILKDDTKRSDYPNMLRYELSSDYSYVSRLDNAPWSNTLDRFSNSRLVGMREVETVAGLVDRSEPYKRGNILNQRFKKVLRWLLHRSVTE